MKDLYSQRKNERGSAILLIFLGVIMFGALSFAISRIMHTGDSQSIGREKSGILAGELLDYARAIRLAIQDMRISNGCLDNDISFTFTGSDGYQHGAPDTCKVFHASGGGISHYLEASNGETWMFKSALEIEDVGSTCGDATCTELFAYIAVPNDQLCDAINERLGLPADINGGTFPANIITAPLFNGSYTYSGTLGNLTAPEIAGKSAACIDHSDETQGSLFYFVLLPR